MRHKDGYGILPSLWLVGETGGKSATRKDDISGTSRFSSQSRESRENNEIRITGGESHAGELGGVHNGLV